MVAGNLGDAGPGERGGIVGQARCSEARQDAEDEIEGADDDLCRQAHSAGGDAEVGEKPKSVGGECGGDAGDQGFEIRLGEAVEEEVGDDEIILFSVGWVEVQGVGMVDLQAGRDIGTGCFAAATEEFEHGCACVDGVGLEVGVLCE